MHEEYPVGIWASTIRYYNNLCQRYSINTLSDLTNFKNPELPEPMSINTKNRISTYLSLSPDKRKQLKDAGIFDPKPNSKSDVISRHKKVELLLEFCKTGQEPMLIDEYNKHPVGKWAMIFRTGHKLSVQHSISTQDDLDQLAETGKITDYAYQAIQTHLNLTSEEFTQLDAAGIFEPKFDSTIEEKIDELIDWNSKYPFAQANPKYIEFLKGYSHSAEEYQQLLTKHQRICNHYDYIRSRRSGGHLTPEQEQKCKEGNVRGVFGYPSETESLSKKFRISPDKIDYILSKYHSIENYITAYRAGSLDKQDLDILGDNLASLRFDINTGGPVDPFFLRVSQAAWGSPKNQQSNRIIKLFDVDKVLEAISALTDREANTLAFRYGLYDNKIYTLEEIAKMLNSPSREAIRSSEHKALRKLRHRSNLKYFSPVYDDSAIDEQSLSPDEQSRRASILDKIYGSNLIFIPDDDFVEEPNSIDSSELKDMVSNLYAIQQNSSQRKSKKQQESQHSNVEDNFEIETTSSLSENPSSSYSTYLQDDLSAIPLGTRAINALRDANITNVSELIRKTAFELLSIPNLGKTTLDEIQKALSALGPLSTISSYSDPLVEYTSTVPTPLEASKNSSFETSDILINNPAITSSSNHVTKLDTLSLLKKLQSILAKELQKAVISAELERIDPNTKEI